MTLSVLLIGVDCVKFMFKIIIYNFIKHNGSGFKSLIIQY